MVSSGSLVDSRSAAEFARHHKQDIPVQASLVDVLDECSNSAIERGAHAQCGKRERSEIEKERMFHDWEVVSPMFENIVDTNITSKEGARSMSKYEANVGL